MRILITGSRDWDARDVIENYLIEYGYGFGKDVTVVSGACPTGADAMCEAFALSEGWTVERHPADWSIGKRAGYVRNAIMVRFGADICLAFIKNNSKGATMTANLAEKAGIRTIRIIPHPEED